jgi:hypothetical protein
MNLNTLRRDTVINDKMYSILLPTPRKAMPLCTRLAVLFGALIPTLIKEAKSGGMEAFGEALKSVDPDAIDNAFMEAVGISHLCVNNAPISTVMEFDKHFTNYRNEVYQVCAWALWECVKDFFPQLDGFNLDKLKSAVTASPSQKVGQ